jgi:hypothetical protein
MKKPIYNDSDMYNVPTYNVMGEKDASKITQFGPMNFYHLEASFRTGKIYFFKAIQLLIILLFFTACTYDNNSESDLDDKPVLYVLSVECKQSYKVGDTFNAENNRLWVEYENGIVDIITGGFTIEWSEEIFYNYLPIKHGDPLPVEPLYLCPAVFYVRGVYQGIIGDVITTCSVSK